MPVATLEGPQGVVRVAHFDSSSRRVVGASWDGTARVWDATSPYRRWSSAPISDDCGILGGLESDRRFVAIGCLDSATRVWDTASDKLLAELPEVLPPIGDFATAFPAVSSAGDRAAIARGTTVAIYELPGGRLMRTIVHSASVSAIAFATERHDLVSGATDGSVLIAREGSEPIALLQLGSAIDATAFLSNGRVVVADARPRLTVYDPQRSVELAVLEVATRVRSLRLSPDGVHLITIPSYSALKPIHPLFGTSSATGLSLGSTAMSGKCFQPAS